MGRPRRSSTPSLSEDSRSNSSSSDTSETDLTELDTDDEGPVVDLAIWPEDEDLPPQYWQQQLEENDELSSADEAGEDYAPSTLNSLNRAHGLWNKFCSNIKKDPRALLDTLNVRLDKRNLRLLYTFFDFFLKKRRGKGGRRLRGTTKKGSLKTYWRSFKQVYHRLTGENMPLRWSRQMRKPLQKVAKKHGLSGYSRDKTPIDVEDLAAYVELNTVTTKVGYTHGRHRVQVNLFLSLESLSGNRPDALLHLRYKNIIVSLIRDPEGGPYSRVIEFTPEFTKTFLGESKSVKWPVPEVIFDPTLILSPHVWLFGVIFADEAFTNEDIRSPEDLDRLYVEPFKNEQLVLLKSELDEKWVFRQPVKMPRGLEVPLEAPRLRYSTIIPYMKKASKVLGLKDWIPYRLRYNFGAKANASGEVSESVQNMMMHHAHIRTYLNHYLSRRVGIDTRAMVGDLPPQQGIIRATNRMSRSIDPRRPYELTKEQFASVNTNPRVVAFVDERKEMQKQFVGGVTRNQGTPLHDKYTELGKELANLRKRLRDALLREVILCWEKEQPYRDVQRQLNGEKYSDIVREKLDSSTNLLPTQRRMAETIMTMPASTYEGEVQRRNAAIKAVMEHCKVQEGWNPRNRSAQVLTINTMQAASTQNVQPQTIGEVYEILLEQAISSIFKDKRALYCFLCLGRGRIHKYHSTRDLTEYFCKVKLKKLKDNPLTDCELCQKKQMNEWQLRNHAWRVHGTVN